MSAFLARNAMETAALTRTTPTILPSENLGERRRLRDWISGRPKNPPRGPEWR